jgi:phosphoglycolate phosphatase
MQYFDVLIGREDVTHPKPHPEPVIKALHVFHAPKQTCWMIGDTCMDMIAAADAGIHGIGVTCGYGTAEQLARCTTHVTHSPLAAVEKIMKLSQIETIS